MKRTHDNGPVPKDRPGYVLLVVLIVVVVLSLSAYHFSELMTSEYAAAVRTTEAAQARALAVSGLHYAAGVLADPDSFENLLGGNPFDNPGAFSNIVAKAAENPRHEGRFAIVAVANEGDSSGPAYQTRYGVTDEGGKININAWIQFDSSGQRLHDALMKLPNMTEDVADAIVDWVDADDEARAAGGESSYYAGLPQPYQAKNGPLNSLDELLLVKGVTVPLLYGNDRNRNGVADDGTDGSSVDRGWSDYLTVYGRELNTDGLGEPRVYVNGTEDLPLLYEDMITAVGQEMADYIMAYRLYGGSTVSGGSSSGSNRTSRLPLTLHYQPVVQRQGGGRGGSAGGGSGGDSGGRGASGGSSGGRGNSSGSNSSSGGRSSSPGGASGSSSQQGRGTSSSAGGGSASSSTSSKTVTGSAQDLQAAVMASLADPNVQAKSKLKSLSQLVNTQVTLPKPKNAPASTPTIVVRSPLNDTNRMAELLPALMDKLSTKGAFELSPRINVNTAPREVLLALTALTASSSSAANNSSASSNSLTEADVDAILAARDGLSPTDAALDSPAWVMTLAGIKPTVFQQLEDYVTTRSSIYRVQAIGYFAEGGPVARVEAVIDTNQGSPRFLSFRDLTDLDTPRGFEPPR